MSDLTRDDRPEYRNIHITQIAHYRLPLAGILSILHRISGAGLFLFMPVLLWLFHLSLASVSTYAQLQGIGALWYVRILLVLLAWAFLHHLCAGVRYLLLDVHVGVEKDASRRSSVVVFAVSVPLALLAALKLFGVF